MSSVESILKSLESAKASFDQRLSAAKDSSQVEDCRVAFLGKKGQLSAILASLKDLSPDDRRQIGARSNEVKAHVEARLSEKQSAFERDELNEKLLTDKLDSSAPGVFFPSGSRHPLKQILNEAISILERAGLKPTYGPEVEFEDFCFDRLNFKPGHAARDMQATFFMKDSPAESPTVLRTHTSPVQVRVLMAAAQAGSPLPIRIQAPGRVYRVDDDATHAPMFHQIEGLVVDTSSTMGDLKACLEFFFKNFFDQKTKIRFRPSYFPFTEPSAEVDISCVFCSGNGCRVCKTSGWLEVAGAGMVHPEVFRACGWEAEKVQGWAFGMGIERLTMLKLGVPDLRLFFENRLSFLRGHLK